MRTNSAEQQYDVGKKKNRMIKKIKQTPEPCPYMRREERRGIQFMNNVQISYKINRQ